MKPPSDEQIAAAYRTLLAVVPVMVVCVLGIAGFAYEAHHVRVEGGDGVGCFVGIVACAVAGIALFEEAWGAASVLMRASK